MLLQHSQVMGTVPWDVLLKILGIVQMLGRAARPVIEAYLATAVNLTQPQKDAVEALLVLLLGPAV